MSDGFKPLSHSAREKWHFESANIYQQLQNLELIGHAKEFLVCSQIFSGICLV